MTEEPAIAPELLDNLRRCQFERHVFAPYPSLQVIETAANTTEWHVSKPYTGEPFDPEMYELIDGGWDHEHCDVCWATINDGMTYWPNINLDVGLFDLCEGCHPRVMALLSAESPP